jgi:hypothetical protein
MTGIATVFDYLNAGGVLAVLILFGFGFYTGRVRLGKDFDEQEEELDTCRNEIKTLWAEKIADKEKSAELAQAYLKIREADKQ